MINKGEILVIDNFIDKDYQEEIKENLIGDIDFPWYYTEDVTSVSYTHLTLPTIYSV